MLHCLHRAFMIIKQKEKYNIMYIRSDQSLSRVRLFATPRIAAHRASLSNTNSRSSLRLTSIESMMIQFTLLRIINITILFILRLVFVHLFVTPQEFYRIEFKRNTNKSQIITVNRKIVFKKIIFKRLLFILPGMTFCLLPHLDINSFNTLQFLKLLDFLVECFRL